MKHTKRLLSALLTFCLLLGLLPTAAFASPQEEAAAMAAVEEGTLLNDTLSLTGKELPVIGEAEDEELSLTLTPPQPEEAPGLTEEVPQVFSAGARASSAFQMTVPAAGQSYYYYGGDLGGTIGVSGASHGWSGRGRGNFNASVSGSGSSYTLTVAEKEKYKKSNIIYQPFALSMEVPAYSSKVLDLDLSIEGQRNSKGAASYYLELFIWGPNGDRAASTKFNVGETRNPTPGAAMLTTGYRYFSDSKSGGVSTGKLSLSFTNVSGTAKTVTYYMGAYVGMNSSTSLLSSYHHTLNAYFKFSASKVTTTEYAAAVDNTPYVWVNDAIREYNAAPGSYLRLFKDYYTNASITLNQGGTVDLGGKRIWLSEGATLDVRGGSGTTTQIANGTIDGEAAAITHSGAGSLYLGADDGGKNPLKVFGQQIGVLNNGGDLYLLDGVQLRGSKENGIKNTGKGNISLQGAPSIYGGTHDIDLGSTGLLRLRKALTNTSPYSVYLPNYTASVEAPRRVTDVWSSKMGSADPNQYLNVSVQGKEDRPMPALVQQNLTGGGTALVARPYIVSLRPNGGSGVPAYIAIGPYRLIAGLPNPTRPGYTFDGWFLNGDRNQPVRNNEIRCTSDTVLVAGWSYKKYIIIIENPDGTKTEKEIAPEETYGDSLPQPPTPPAGKEFDHWETSDGEKVDENTPVADTIDPETGNPKPLIPVYKAKIYTITFDYRMPSARPFTRRLEYGKSYGVLPTTARKGYTFLGWYTHETAGEQVTADTPIPAGDQTLYAHWAANSYTVSFDLNEGEGTAPPAQSVSYQAKYTLPADPTRINYTFTGWYTAETGGTRVTADTILTNAADHTLYAQWSRKVYTATFQSDSKTVETRQVNAGDALGALPSVTKTGYTLTGWGGVTAETVPTGSETYTAAWTANAYTVTLDPSGGTMGGSTTQSVTYDAAYGSLPTPTRTGYSFTGWFTAQSGGSQVNSASTVKKAADHTLYARWTANTYAVRLDAGGGSVGTDGKSVTFGQPYGTLPVPTRDGFNFVGWQDESGRTVSAATPVSTAEDHTLTAQWAQKHIHKVDPNGNEGEVEFQELTAETVNGGAAVTYTLTSGQWYLSGDITTTKPIYISGAVDLCLNGHTLTYTGEELRAIQLRENAVFNVCDCQGTGGIKGEGVAHYPGEANQDRNSTELLTSGKNTTINLYGVTLTSNAKVVSTVANSTLTLDGARLVAEGQSGYTLDAGKDSSVTVKNSSIENKATEAVRVSTSDFTVIGGSITTTANGAGLYVFSDAQATLSGSPTIRGRNYDIFLLGRNSWIAVDGELTGQYRVNANSLVAAITETAPWPIANALDKDYSAHFILPSSDTRYKQFAIRDVIEGGKHALEIYRFHRHQPCGGTSCAHSGPAHNGAVEYQPLAITGGILNDGHYYLTEDITLTNYLKIQGNVSLCLNGHTIFAPGDTTGSTYNKRLNVSGVLALSDCKTGGKIINDEQNGFAPVSVGENGTLNLYSGIIEKTTSGNAVESPAGNKLVTVNVYGGTIIASRAIDMGNGDKTGNLLLSGSPVIQSTSDSLVFIGGKPGFLVLDGSLQKPSVPYQVTLWNMNTRDSHVVLTTGWPTMGDADPNDYFVSPKALELEKNEEGELVLRCHWVNKEGVGVIYLSSNGDFKTGDLDQPDSRVGYLWDGWYTAENGGGRKLETGYNRGKIYEDDTTIYPYWTECDHIGHSGAINKIDATCTTAEREQFTCNQCGLEVDRAVGEVPGHSYKDEWVTDSAAHWYICGSCGVADPDSRAQHVFGEPTGTEAGCTQAGSQTRSCNDCGYTLTETYTPLGHELAGWNSDESDHWNVCVREGCGVESEEKTPHTWGDWQLSSAPQVNVPGEETAFCADCGRTKTQAVAALPVPEYAVTYTVDEYTQGDAPIQATVAEAASFALPTNDSSGLTRTGYTLAGWVLLDQEGVPGEEILTGQFAMLGRDVVFRVRWDRVPNYELKPGETIVLPDGTVIKNESGGTVTIDQGGDGEPETTITLPGGGSVTVQEGSGEEKDKVVVPPGSIVETFPGDGEQGPVITIGNGEGKVDPSGKVDAPVGTTVTDKDGNTITITEGTGGAVDPDGVVTFPEGTEGKVTVTDKDGNETQVTVPGGGDGMDVTPGGVPIVNNPDGSLTIPDGEGGSTTVTVPEDSEEGGEVDDNGNITLPGGSKVETEDKDGNKTEVTVPDGGGMVKPDGTVTKIDQAKPVGIFKITDINDEHPTGSITVIRDADKLEWRRVTDPESPWTPVAESGATATLDGLEGGDYEFRYKETDTHEPSPATLVQIRTKTAEDKKLDVAADIVHGEVTRRRPEVTPGDTVNLTVTPEAGYELSSLAANYGDGESITPDPDPENGAHYTFTMPDADVTVTATFAPIVYTIDYQWAGVADGSFTVEDGTIDLALPTQDGYTFAGWAYTKDGPVITNVTAAALLDRVKDRSVKLYPVWTEDLPVLETFTVSFDAQGGSPIPADQIVAEGKLAVKPKPSPTKAGHNFSGWYTREDGGKAWQFNVYTVSEDTVLYAGWSAKDFGSEAVTPENPVEFPGGGTVTKDPDTGDVIIAPPEDTPDGPTTTITPPSGGEDVTVDPDAGNVNVPGGSTVDPGNGVKVELPDGGKVDGDGNITLPDGGGAVTIPDGEGGGSTTITAPDGGGTIRPTDDGKLEVPGGSTVKTGEDGTEATVPDGGAKVDGEGNITVPGGSTITIPDGQGGKTEVTVPDDEDETVVKPTDDGKLEVPGGSAVKPEGGPEITVDGEGGKVDGEGGVTVPGGSTVTVPDGKGGELQITLPAGDEGTIRPTGNGKLEVPAGSTVKKPDGSSVNVPTGGGIVDPGTGDMDPIIPPGPGPDDDDDDDDDDYVYVPIGGKPSVTVSGEGGKAEADRKGSVTITPDKGYEIGRITVNGKEVAIPKDGVLTGLKHTDKVVVTFRKLPEVPTVSVDRFVDVKRDDWFYESVKAIVERELMVGTDETHFSPHLSTSRAMIAVILWRLEGSPEPRMGQSYPDCLPGSWYAQAVAWAGEEGIVKGYDNGNFGPQDPITREQLAAMLWRYTGTPAAKGSLTGFSDDREAGPWALDALRWAVEKGILTGRGGGVLDPAGQASRAEAAAMLLRFIER